MDLAQYCVFIGWVGIEKDNLYLHELSFVSSRFYLKNIIFGCRNEAQVDDSLAFDGCCAILRFYALRGVGKDKWYLREFLFVSFRIYLKNIVFMCRNTAQVDDSLAFDGCCVILRFYGLRGVGKDKWYLCEFVFVSISKTSYLCVETRPRSTTAWRLTETKKKGSSNWAGTRFYRQFNTFFVTSCPLSIIPARVLQPAKPAKTPTRTHKNPYSCHGCGFWWVGVRVALEYPRVTCDNP